VFLASQSPLLREGGLCASATKVAVFKTTHNLSLCPFCCGMMWVPQLNHVGSTKETFDVVECEDHASIVRKPLFDLGKPPTPDLVAPIF
jgi:hypothetical protein